MPIGFCFWVLIILWLVLGMYWNWPDSPTANRRSFGLIGGNLLLFILIFLLGWKVFGFVVQ